MMKYVVCLCLRFRDIESNGFQRRSVGLILSGVANSPLSDEAKRCNGVTVPCRRGGQNTMNQQLKVDGSFLA